MTREERFIELFDGIDDKFIKAAAPRVSKASEIREAVFAGSSVPSGKTGRKHLRIPVLAGSLAAAAAVIAAGFFISHNINTDVIQPQDTIEITLPPDFTATAEPVITGAPAQTSVSTQNGAVTLPPETSLTAAPAKTQATEELPPAQEVPESMLVKTDLSMPEPLGYFDDDSYYDFLYPWKRRFGSVPGSVEKASALSGDEINEVFAGFGFGIHGNETPCTLSDSFNLYECALRLGLTRAQLADILEQDNETFRIMERERGRDNSDVIFTDEELDAVRSGSTIELCAAMMSEYSIIKGEYVLSPYWLYWHTEEDYAKLGISKLIIQEKLRQYSSTGYSVCFGISEEAWAAFSRKLNHYAYGIDVSLTQPPRTEPLPTREAEQTDTTADVPQETALTEQTAETTEPPEPLVIIELPAEPAEKTMEIGKVWLNNYTSDYDINPGDGYAFDRACVVSSGHCYMQATVSEDSRGILNRLYGDVFSAYEEEKAQLVREAFAPYCDEDGTLSYEKITAVLSPVKIYDLRTNSECTSAIGYSDTTERYILSNDVMVNYQPEDGTRYMWISLLDRRYTAYRRAIELLWAEHERYPIATIDLVDDSRADPGELYIRITDESAELDEIKACLKENSAYLEANDISMDMFRFELSDEYDTERVGLSAEAEDVTTGGIRAVYHFDADRNGGELMELNTGGSFFIECKEDGEWQDISVWSLDIDYEYPDLDVILDKDSTSYTDRIRFYTGDLPAGEYRIKKYFTVSAGGRQYRKILYIPFDITPATPTEWGLYITAGDISPTGMTIEMIKRGGNFTGKQITTSSRYSIDRLVGGKWRECEAAKGADASYWIALPDEIALEENTPVIQTLDWEKVYGALPEGEYRIEKVFSDGPFSYYTDRKGFYIYFTISDWGVSLTADNASSGGVTVTIEQSGGAHKGTLGAENPYVLEKLTDGGIWTRLMPTKHYPSSGLGEKIGEGIAYTVDFSERFDEPPEKGRYRIGFRVTDFVSAEKYEQRIYYAEFDIE